MNEIDLGKINDSKNGLRSRISIYNNLLKIILFFEKY